MEHSFDIDIAKKYGIPAAVLLKNIQYWIEKNRANNKNFYDGYYWTYNSKAAFAELFPYMTARQIDYALQKLIDDGLIITSNYNKVAYDRTLWYAITKKGYSILQNCEMEETNLSNGNGKNVEPIPNNKPIEKQSDNNTNIKDKYISEFAELWALYPNKKGKDKALNYYIKARKKGVEFETVKQGILDYSKECEIKNREKQYIKHGSTWFGNSGWNDEYDFTPAYQQKDGKTYGINGIAITDEKSDLDELF